MYQQVFLLLARSLPDCLVRRGVPWLRHESEAEVIDFPFFLFKHSRILAFFKTLNINLTYSSNSFRETLNFGSKLDSSNLSSKIVFYF